MHGIFIRNGRERRRSSAQGQAKLYPKKKQGQTCKLFREITPRDQPAISIAIRTPILAAQTKLGFTLK